MFLHQDFIVERRFELLVGKNNTISNDNLILDRYLFAKDRDALALDTVLGHGCRVAMYWAAFNSGPCTNSAVPTNNSVQHTASRLFGIPCQTKILHIYTHTLMSTYVYNHIVQDNGILDSHTLADNSAGSN